MSNLWESENHQNKYNITVGDWFIECVPPLHPLWNHYKVICISLKEDDDLPPPYKQFPEATHELIVVALDRDKQPTYDDPDSYRFLTPVNYTYQFKATGEQAREICEEAARKFARSELLLEVAGIHGARKLNDHNMNFIVRKWTADDTRFM